MSESTPRRAGLGRIVEKHSNLLAGLASLLAAILGLVLFFVNQARTEAQGDVTGLQQQVGALQQKVDLRDGTIRTLEETTQEQALELQEKDERIRQLEAQYQDEDRPVPAADSPPIRRQGEVALANNGDVIDINAPSGDLTWGAGKIDYNEPGGIQVSTGYLQFYGMGVAFLEPDQAGSYEVCSTRTDYAEQYGLDPNDLDGRDLCLRTEEGRFATVRLIGEGESTVTLSITIWELS